MKKKILILDDKETIAKVGKIFEMSTNKCKKIPFLSFF